MSRGSVNEALRRRAPSGLFRGPADLLVCLRTVSISLHPEPTELRHDEELFEILLSLYGTTPTEIWRRLRRFLETRREGLEILYAEHRSLPEAELLDLVEAPMILELLERDSARLSAAWPGSPAPLLRLANAAGTPIAHLF